MVDNTDKEGSTTPVVLVVDDHDLVRKMVVSSLVKEGFNVLSASSGLEALDMVRENTLIRCLLLDLSMPNMSGEEVLEEVYRIRPKLAVLVYSAHEESAVAHRLSGNVSGYLQKPFDPETLFAKLRALLNT